MKTERWLMNFAWIVAFLGTALNIYSKNWDYVVLMASIAFWIWMVMCEAKKNEEWEEEYELLRSKINKYEYMRGGKE